MGVADHPDVLAAGPEFHCDDRFGDQLGSERADDVHAEYHVGFRVGDEFYEAGSVAERPPRALAMNGKVPAR